MSEQTFTKHADVKFQTDLDWDIVRELNKSASGYKFLFDEAAGHWILVEKTEE